MSEALSYPQLPEGLAQLAAIVEATLVDEGVEPVRALTLSRVVTERIRRGLGGTYIPRKSIEYVRREIARRWDGNNTRDLCDEFGVGERRLRQLAEEGRADLNTDSSDDNSEL